jgi:phospholipid transport system transporter-binding protein
VSLTTHAILLPNTLRHDQAMAWLEGVSLSSGSHSSADVDASQLTSFDSTALACLLEVRRRAQSSGVGLQITGLPTRLQKLAQVYGLADLL